MKKTMFAMLCLLLAVCLFFGCSAPAAVEESPADLPSSSPTSTPTPTPTPTPEPTPLPLDKPVEVVQLRLSVPSAWEEVSELGNRFYYYPPNEEGLTSLTSFLYIDSDSISYELELGETPESILDSYIVRQIGYDAPEPQQVMLGGEEALRFEYETVLLNEPAKAITHIILKNANIYMIYAVAKDETQEPMITLPSILESISFHEPTADFLLDDEVRQKVNASIDSFDFQTVVDLANAYLEENPQAPAEDTVHEILALATAGAEQMKNCKVVGDDFEGDYAVYYKGVEKISKSINLMPYLDGGDFRVKMGFRASDWLFFEEIKIKVGEDEYITHAFDSWDIEREVDNGISEIIDIRFDREDATRIVEADGPVMRFENDEGKTRDHELTKDEIAACQTIMAVDSTESQISTIVYNWESEFGLE